MGLSQPSLSQAVRILEDAVQAKLFLRSQKGVELTPAGIQLLHFSERLLSEVEGVENRLRHPEQPMTGTIKLGTYASVISYLLPKFLVHMAEKYNRLSIGVTTLLASEQAGGLTERRCHFVVGTGSFAQKTITQVELYEDDFGFFCAPSRAKKISEASVIYVSGVADAVGEPTPIWVISVSIARSAMKSLILIPFVLWLAKV